ncbi:PREDICTED: plexin-C1, partial [Gavialis gangeticus]|uniref:plexin-C1 n=1 Tax=Gavialis gangeticus TaxID=94835 RepID=UPI00092ED110
GGSCLFELEPALSRARDVLHLGPAGQCAQPAGAHSKLLLPYGTDNRTLAGWTLHKGTCQLLRGLKVERNQSEVVSCLPRGSTAGVVFRWAGGDYVAVAATYSVDGQFSCGLVPSEAKTVLTIRYLGDLMPTDSFDVLKYKHAPLHFVDAFLWHEHLFFPYYRLPHGPPSVVVLNSRGHFHTPSQVRLSCGCRGHILASSILPQQGFWAAVFANQTEQPAWAAPAWDNTALCLFDLAFLQDANPKCLSNDFDSTGCETVPTVKKSPTLIHSDLSAVYATVVLNKIVLFLGTNNGQLLKVILNKNLEPNCPEILHEIEEETPVFPKLALDPVDSNYIYLASANEVRRIQVANCSNYVSHSDCLSAEDPYCEWCHLTNRCTLKGNCTRSDSLPDLVNSSHEVDQYVVIQIRIMHHENKILKIIVMTVGNVPPDFQKDSFCRIKNAKQTNILCENEKQQILNCSCSVTYTAPTTNDCSAVEVSVISGSWNLSETVLLPNCLHCSGTGENDCSCWPNDDVIDQYIHINSIKPSSISTLGKGEVIIEGRNFTQAPDLKVVLTGPGGCKRKIISVGKVLNDTHMIFSLPPGRKEAKRVCISTAERKCSSPVTLYYVSLPSCINIRPNSSWASGGRKITLFGRNVNVADGVVISDEQRSHLNVSSYPENTTWCHFLAPAVSHAKASKIVDVLLKVENVHKPCIKLQYHPDPVFISYQLQTEMDPHLELKLYKENDNLDISKNEIEVFLQYESGSHLRTIHFSVQNITKNPKRSTVLCKGKRESQDKIDFSTVKIYVKLGNLNHEVKAKSSHMYLYVLILLPVLLLAVIVVAFIVTRRKSKELTHKLSEQLELLECELRKEIREGFAELQMDMSDVVDSFGTVPFLDYKHFALRTFFPEPKTLAAPFTEDMHTSVPPDRDQTHKDESLTLLQTLICNKNFLVTLIHTFEKQKTFSVKDRCLFASYLTIALQTKLVYLTRILEVLTKDLMEQSSNVQPKLMLRRTESVVEKLLTNWMSVCLSGFLRETVGETFYLLVTALNQRINKGPVDVITCKALNTLNEDWLLWQVTEFSTLTLNIIFEKTPDNENADTCQTISVSVLDCDTIGQAKEKIFQAFVNKNGSLYGLQLDEIGLELQSGAQQKELSDIDESSPILEDGKTKLNTIGHYGISDGATVKVLKKKTPDVDYSDEYCHLILPNSETVKDIQGAKTKGKQKFKVKEMYLTKLLSTKVAIHSVVEKLFRSIWSLPNNKAPVAIKYFFDFLDAQAESKKITDPDVVHIWKTNSLPLRFWVNILKNPQFVFDIKKTPHIDGCLSVIAQAFMDAFSLTEHQLGKEAPTNKLLYAKDIPLYKEEVKAYYKEIRDLPPLSSSEVDDFLIQESKKHENEFNEEVALTAIYRYIKTYHEEILTKLERDGGQEEALKQLLQVKALFDEKKKCMWMRTEHC